MGNSRYGGAIKIVCSSTPLLAGGAAMLFLVKPLFAGRGAHMQPLALSPEAAPPSRRLHDHEDRLGRRWIESGVRAARQIDPAAKPEAEPGPRQEITT